MVTASISLRDVGRAFGATRALTGVGLDLKPGVTGLLGPNGAGKTTLLRLLATALPPTQGQVSVLGLDPEVPAERTGIRRQLGYLPQEAGFPRGFTAFAFVDYIALLKEWTEPAARHAEVRRVLDLVGLSGLGAKRIRAMSGGQRRRVALAQALLGSPPVLILDEPTTGVDPEQRVTLRTVLAEIARTSIVVLSTHQTEDVAALCERVIVLDRGRVRYDGLGHRPDRPGGRPGLARRRSRTRQRPSPGGPAPAGTATSAPTCATASNTSNHPSRTPTCCCAAGHRSTRPPGRWRHDHDTRVRPACSRRRPDRARPLAAREMRRFVLNPVFLSPLRDDRVDRPGADSEARSPRSTGVKQVRGGLFRRVRHDGRVLADPVDARQRTGRRRHPDHAAGPHRRPVRGRDRAVLLRLPDPARVPALHPVGDVVYGAFSPSARLAVLVGQIVVPSLGGPLLGVALGRWVRFPGAAFVLFLILFGWVKLVTALTLARPDSAPVAVLRLFSPFAFFTLPGGRRRRHGLARVAVVLHRLAARPVRDRGPGGDPARGRRAGALPHHPCSRRSREWRP